MDVLYQIVQSDWWGDYGDALVSGYGDGEDEQGRLLLARTGPFVPPISFPGPSGTVVVTDEFRNQLEAMGFRGLGYKEVVKARIVRFEWRHWNRDAELDGDQLPACEPEDYILKERHSPKLAREMTRLWEITAERRIRCIRLADRSTALVAADWTRDVDVFQSGFSRIVLVNGRVREFLMAHCGEWCDFVQMAVADSE